MLNEDLCPRCGGAAWVSQGVLHCNVCGDQEVQADGLDTPIVRTEEELLTGPKPEPRFLPDGPVQFQVTEEHAKLLQGEAFSQRMEFVQIFFLNYVESYRGLPKKEASAPSVTLEYFPEKKASEKLLKLMNRYDFSAADFFELAVPIFFQEKIDEGNIVFIQR